MNTLTTSQLLTLIDRGSKAAAAELARRNAEAGHKVVL